MKAADKKLVRGTPFVKLLFPRPGVNFHAHKVKWSDSDNNTGSALRFMLVTKSIVQVNW